MNLVTVQTEPYDDQRPGTAGLRKRVDVVRQRHYLENFVQSVLRTCFPRGSTLVVGGDGRFFNAKAIQTIVRIGAAHGLARLIIGRQGWLSTPAAAHLIRHHDADGGLILTASHNPGGPKGDFGVKINVRGGGQASAAVAEEIWRTASQLREYAYVEADPIALDEIATTQMIGETRIDIVDPVDDYRDLQAGLFDFDAIRTLLTGNFRFRFDALNAITGPYAHRLLVDELGAPADSIVNATPLADFGGGHPDPNPVDAAGLVATMGAESTFDFAAASDGDGDRNMILAPGLVVSPGDSLALLVAHARSVPGYREGLTGVARSMPTARAVDRVAARLGIPCYETPTGWRYFSTLLQSGRITLCGEESFGTGSTHVREKDGLWAVLFWLNVLAVTRQSVAQLVHAHWQQFGRDFYARHDYTVQSRSVADDLMSALGKRVGKLAGERAGSLQIAEARRFDYTDPVDASVTMNQGFMVHFTDGARAVLRLSGTGTGGATLRVYLDRHLHGDIACHQRDRHAVLADVAFAANAIARIDAFTGLTAPSAVI
ncbi:MAG: alpha-D-glucose phosphate-specific phosphoglucomutase [Pseudomonadota bacterium]